MHLNSSGESNMKVMIDVLCNMCRVCERKPNFN